MLLKMLKRCVFDMLFVFFQNFFIITPPPPALSIELSRTDRAVVKTFLRTAWLYKQGYLVWVNTTWPEPPLCLLPLDAG